MNWLTVDEAAEYIRRHKSTMYNLVNARKLPSYKIGKGILLLKEDLDAYIEAHRRDPVEGSVGWTRK